ncbi:MAG: proprotein convertase P-domain-containing protein, partial [Saprospiraceae bacterium]|nr:proprotein convertase P-domain-containing protein [Saprospiraceae bacterium]
MGTQTPNLRMVDLFFASFLLKALGVFLCIFIFFCANDTFAQAQNCQAENLPVVINDNTTTSVNININGALNDDLSDPVQGICGIKIKFKHTFVGDLVVRLRSPIGQTVTLIGPSTFLYPPTPLTTWNIAFVTCSSTANPDPGQLQVWTNNQNWPAFGTLNGVYYPVQCLDIFNNGPVNGTWTLDLIDTRAGDIGQLIEFELVFCDDTGLNCQVCEANAGSITNHIQSLSVCEGDPQLNLAVPPEYIANAPDVDDYDYAYILSEQSSGIILEYLSNTDLTALDTGYYSLCGISYLQFDETKIPTPDGSITVQDLRDNLNGPVPIFCGNISSNCIDIDIHPTVPPTDITSTLCEGESIQIGTNSYFTSGNYRDTLSSLFGCDSIITLQLTILPKSITNIDTVLCAGNCIQVAGKMYCASGNYLDTLIAYNGCDSIIMTNLLVIEVDAQLIAPTNILTCNIPNIDLDASSSSANIPFSYLWTATNGGTINGANDVSILNVNEAGDYKVLVEASSGGVTCRDSSSFAVFDDLIKPFLTTISNTQLNCKYDSLLLMSLNNNNSWSYEWFNSGSVISVNDTLIVRDTGEYKLIVTGLNGCQDSIIYFVDQDTLHPVVVATGDELSCANSALVQLNGSILPMLIEHYWLTPSNDTVFQLNPFVDEAGIYTLFAISNQNFCLSSDTAIVTANVEIPMILLSADTFTCVKNSINIAASTNMDGLLFDWEGPNTFSSQDSSFTTSISGTYIVTITATNGCQRVAFIETTSDTLAPSITIQSTDILDCNTNEVTLSIQNTFQDDEISWFYQNTIIASDTTQIIVSDSGFYSVIVRTSNGCENIDSFYVERIDNAPDIEIVGNNTLTCSVVNISLQANSTVNNPTFTWEYPNGNLEQSSNIVITEGGIYYVSVTDSNNCISVDSIEIFENNIPPPHQISVSEDTISCDTNRTLINIKLNPTQSAAYEWILPNGTHVNSQVLLVGLIGVYYVTVTPENACVFVDSIEIYGSTDLPNIYTTDNEFNCGEDSVQISVVSSTPNVTFAWTGPGGFTSTLADPFVTEVGLYTVVATSANNCSVESIVEVGRDDSLPDISVVGDTLECNQVFGQIFANSNTPNVEYEWY